MGVVINGVVLVSLAGRCWGLLGILGRRLCRWATERDILVVILLFSVSLLNLYTRVNSSVLSICHGVTSRLFFEGAGSQLSRVPCLIVQKNWNNNSNCPNSLKQLLKLYPLPIYCQS